MANDATMQDPSANPAWDSDDAEALVTFLEKSLREPTSLAPGAEAETRGRLLRLYLGPLRDPLSAAVHAEALLQRDNVDRAVLDAAAELVDFRPVGARIAVSLAAAYARTGEVMSEVSVLTKELKLAKLPRLDEVKRRLADLHFERLDDADGALDLLEPLLLRHAGDNALRARYVHVATASGGRARAIRTLLRVSRTEKDASSRARILTDLGGLFVEEGDTRRASQAFAEAVDVSAGDAVGLPAARQLLRLSPDAKDPKLLGDALSTIARGATDSGEKVAAAEQLLSLLGADADDDRALVAWRALLDDLPRGAEALERVVALLERRSDVAGLMEILRTRRPPRETFARWVPLFEKAGRWQELAELLERQASLSPPPEAAAANAKLGRIRATRLSDAEGAFKAFKASLAADPANAASRAELEKLMAKGDFRAKAADLLEPVYQKEGFADGLARVLAVRAELSTSPAERLAALDRAFETARSAASSGKRLATLAESGLVDATRHDPPALPVWLARYRALAPEWNDPVRDAAVFVDALGGRPVDRPELVELACAAIDALARAGKAAPARSLAAAALSGSPASMELLARRDSLAPRDEALPERLSRYETALAHAATPEERHPILQTLAAMCRDVDDLPRAIELWQRILQRDPRDLDALSGLLTAYERLENPEALFAEIAQALELLEGEARQVLLCRKAQALAKFGERERSAALRAELLAEPGLPAHLVETILTAAYEDDQQDVYRRGLEMQSQSDDAKIRMRALERLGDFHFERMGDRRAAVDSWLPAARLYTKDSPEDEHARELYERVLEASPQDREAALRLVELYAKEGEWARIPEVYGALLRADAGLESAIPKLLGLEREATRAGAVDEFVSMVDETVPRLGSRLRESHYRLLQAKARILSGDPARFSDASAAHKQVIESFGGENDLDAFAAFIETRGSATDRHEDLRWLLGFRAGRAPDPVPVLREWAALEEEYGDIGEALALHERILERIPKDREALARVAQLRRVAGDPEGALRALSLLREGEGAARAAELDLEIARLLQSELDRPLDAIRAISSLLRGGRPAPDVLDLVRRALSSEKDRPLVTAAVDAASRSANDEGARALVSALVEGAARDPAIDSMVRASWYLRLVALSGDDTDSAIALCRDGVRDLPNSEQLWEALELHARRGDHPERAADAYRRALGRGMNQALGDTVGRRIIELLDEASSDPDEVLATLERILECLPRARWALDRVKILLSAAGRWDELFDQYDRAVDGAADDRERAALLDEAAVAARDLARSPERAIGFFERLLALRPGDAPVQSALERLYERAGKTERLVVLLSARLETASAVARLETSRRLAEAQLDLGKVDAAAATVDDALSHGASFADVTDVLEHLMSALPLDPKASRDPAAPSVRVIARLGDHYAETGRAPDAVRVARAMLAFSTDPAERARRVEELVKRRLDAVRGRPDAFMSLRTALDGDLDGNDALKEAACRVLLQEAEKEWRRGDLGPDSDPANAAWATLMDLSEVLFRMGRLEQAVAALGKGLELPSSPARKRELRALIARSLANRLSDAARASGVYRELFDEDAGDAVARASAEEFARLLGAAGRDREQAELWERVGEGARGSAAEESRDAWSRAAALWEMLDEDDHAAAAHAEAAALGSGESIEAFARLHGRAGRHRKAAQALEWRFASTTGEARVRVGLALADAWLEEGNPEAATDRLSELVRAEPSAWEPRALLLDLYRAEGEFERLAALLEDTAKRVDAGEKRLTALREAASIRLRKLGDPKAAIPLATAALELDSESFQTRLDLGEALDSTGRHDEAAEVLRAGLPAAGQRRSKNDGALRRAVAGALFHAGRRAEGLAELEAAAKLSPTDPKTLHELSTLASDEGEHDLAERTLRVLLLTLHPGGEAADGPTRAEVYLDLARIAEQKGDAAEAKDLVESAFESSLEDPEQLSRLERALEARGRPELQALAVERRLRTAEAPETIAPALATLVALWEGPLGKSGETRALIARHAEQLGRQAEDGRIVDAVVWNAYERASFALNGEDARKDAVRRRIATLEARVRDATPEESTKLRVEVAAFTETGLGDAERAATLTEALFRDHPSDGAVWERLRDLHRKLGRRDRLVELAEAALGAISAPGLRKLVRRDLATLLLEEPVDVDAAIAALKAALADDPRDGEMRDRLAEVLEKKGRHEELIALLSDAAGGERSPSGVRLRLGRAFERALRAKDAAAVYVALAQDETATVEELRAAVARLEALRSKRLPDCLERLLSRTSGAEAERLARRLADLRTAEGDREGTTRALEAGFAAKPESAWFRDHLVKAYEETQRFRDVVSVLEQALAREPTDRTLVQKLVETHEQSGDLDRALSVLNTALERHPGDPDLLRTRSWIHDGGGRFEPALADMQEAYARDAGLFDDLVSSLAKAAARGDDPRAIALVDLLQSHERPEEARVALDALLERRPNHPGALERLASSAAAEGDWETAGAACQRLLPLLGKDANAVARIAISLADACENRGSIEDAKDALSHALELLPGSAEIRGRLRKAYEASGETGQLADLLEADAEDAASPSEQASLLARAAEILVDEDGQAARALALVEKSRELDPERGDSLLVFGRALARVGRSEEAETAFRGLLRTAKGRVPGLVARAHRELARLHLDRDEIFEAFDSLKLAFAADPKDDAAAYLLGLVALDLDDEAIALRALRAVTARRSTLPAEEKAVALQHLARLARDKDPRRSS